MSDGFSNKRVVRRKPGFNTVYRLLQGKRRHAERGDAKKHIPGWEKNAYRSREPKRISLGSSRVVGEKNSGHSHMRSSVRDSTTHELVGGGPGLNAFYRLRQEKPKYVEIRGGIKHFPGRK